MWEHEIFFFFFFFFSLSAAGETDGPYLNCNSNDASHPMMLMLCMTTLMIRAQTPKSRHVKTPSFIEMALLAGRVRARVWTRFKEVFFL